MNSLLLAGGFLQYVICLWVLLHPETGSVPNNMLALCSSGIFHIWYNPVSLKKYRMSTLLTFLNKSLKLFTLKNCFLGRPKALHPIMVDWLVTSFGKTEKVVYAEVLR